MYKWQEFRSLNLNPALAIEIFINSHRVVALVSDRYICVQSLTAIFNRINVRSHAITQECTKAIRFGCRWSNTLIGLLNSKSQSPFVKKKKIEVKFKIWFPVKSEVYWAHSFEPIPLWIHAWVKDRVLKIQSLASYEFMKALRKNSIYKY